ncbi:uncharacterized protein [Branchiostoma lanceolatum]|uniref:uncharacterized protein isoform X1 n=1 Tax=Branchiostoma lanceolatum TaxID=7740 RepID=UPI003456E09D
MGNVNFNKAKAICRGEGGRLAVLQDEGADIFIRRSIRRLPHRRAQSYWIGLSDAQKEGTFVWSDGTELTTSAYAHWAPGNPDNAAAGDGEDCVEVRPDLDYKWNDVGCREKRRFGCEKDVAPGSDQTMLMTEMPPAGTESPNNPGHEQPHTTSGPDEDGCTWLDQELHEKERELQEQAQIITELTAHLLQKDEEIQDLTIRLQQKDEEIQDVRSQLQQKDEEIQDVTTLLQQKDEEIQDVTTLLQQKDEEIQDVTALLQQKDEEIQDVTALLQQKDEEIQDVRSQLQQKDEEIQVVTSQLQQKDDEIQDVTSQLQQKDEEIQDVISQLQPKDEEIQDFISQFRLMDEEIQDFIFLLQQKDEEIQDLTTRLEQPSPAADHETPVTSTGVNVALGKTAFQTSTLAYRGAASFAVDGNSAANYHAGSCTHTAHMPGEENPSWWVDLGQSYVVDRVVIFNRQDCCSDRINPFNVHIGDSDQVNSNPKCGGDHQINVNQPSISISCQGMKGRYVGVRLPGPLRVLTLCEVQVFSAHIVPEGKWRNDFRCGQGYPAENGIPAECNPDGEGPCCSTANWCGKTRNHCGCKGCADYRDVNGTATGSESRDYTSLGCWRDTADRAIPTLEGTDPRLDGNYQVRPNAIETCYQVARSLGFTVFAVQDGGQCFGSADAHYTHSKYGPSTACAADGEGGPRANEVYGITATGPDARATLCHEAKAMNPTGGDGEYTIYPFTTCTDVSIRVYCHNMASGNPEEFLTLPSGPENNYAIVFADRLRDGHLCDGPLQDQNAGSGTTKFSKVRIKFEDTTIAVVRDDYTFATSTGYNNVSYAEAGDCYSWSQGCAKGTFKVNLDGTELALAPQVDWVMVNTWPGDLTINDMFISEDRTVASARCGGWCGRCRPAESKLRLLHPQCHGQIGTAESLSEEEEIQDLTPPLEQPPPVVQTTVTSSKENCIEGNGASYRGPVSVTETGKMCQRWDRQTPHGHTRGPVYYPSSGLEQNYCRNPDGEAGVWCYTTDPNTRWERCDVPTCESLSGEKIQDVTTPLDQPRAQPAVQTTMTSSEAPATTEVSVPKVERTRCLGSIGYCPGSHATGARCVDGFCECSSTHYQRYTCLPVVGSCATTRGSPVAQAEAFQTADPRETFSCVADDNSQYEVHVLAVYEGVGHTRGFQQDPTGTAEMDVYVRAGQLTKPLVLVLSSYEAVNWVLHLPEVIEVHKVLLMAYYVDQSDVTVRGGSVDDVQRLSGRTGGVPACAYGKDDGGCKTVELLEFINGEFGPVSSLTGTYKADEWNLKVGTSTLETTTTMTAMAPSTTGTTSTTMATTTSIATITNMATTTPMTTSPVATTTTMATTTPMTTSLPTSDGPCPLGYELFEANCYKVFTDQMDYEDSVKACSKDGAILATPRDLATHQFLVELKNKVAGNKYVRIGLTDHVQEGVYEWSDGTPLREGDFDAWEPSPNNNDNNDCVEYVKARHFRRTSRNKWTPATCLFTNMFICQLEGTSTLETTTTMAPTAMAPTTTAMAPTTTETTSSTMAITTTVAKTTSMTLPGNGSVITPTETSSACEGKTLRLSCSAGETLEIDGANFGRTSKSHRCNCGLFCNTINTCYAANSLSIVKSACQGKRECAVEATKSVFGDPCPFIGKYLEATYCCVAGTFILDTTTTTAMAPTTTGITSSTMAITTTVAETTSMTSPGNGPIITPTETSSACEGKTLRLSCSAGETLEIDGANFGRTSKSHRCNCGLFCNTINTCYAANSLSIVKSACQGKRECAVEATKSVFGDPCPFIGKYLEATYRCVPEANIERGDPEEP